MSNKKAVQSHLDERRKLGFRTMSFLVHEDDVDEVRSLVDSLKEKRMNEIFLKPNDTLEEMNRLGLDNKSFGLIHHFKAKASVTAHCNYLKNIQAYQMNSQNYLLAQRIHKLDDLVRNNVVLDEAINEVMEEYPFLK